MLRTLAAAVLLLSFTIDIFNPGSCKDVLPEQLNVGIPILYAGIEDGGLLSCVFFVNTSTPTPAVRGFLLSNLFPQQY